MRKIFSFFAAILFAGSMMAAVGNVYYTFVPQKLSSGNVSDYTKSGDQTFDGMTWNVPGNWYATGALRLGGKSITNVDRVITGKAAMGDAIAKIVITHAGVTSDNLKLNSITVTVASDDAFTQNVETKTVVAGTDFTYGKNTDGTITITPTGGMWALNAYYKFAFNVSNTNSSNYAFVLNKIEFYSYEEGSSTTKTVYCKMTHSWWTQDDAAVAVHHWGGTSAGTAWPGVRMTPVSGEEGTWTYDVPADVDGLMFVRVNGSGDIADWGAKTANLTLPTDGKNLYTITSESAVWGDPGATGEWSVYAGEGGGDTPEPPVAAKFYVTGDSALVTDAGFAGKAWNPDAIKAEADTLVLNLKAEQVYKLKVTTDGTWNTVKGFNDLTEKPEGVTMDNDENIIFSLAEAGSVQVIYIAGETPIFKIAGNFYVDPTPVVPTAAVTGDMTEWGEPIPFELSEDSTFATLYNDNIKKGIYAFKMIINGEWRSNGYEFHRGFPGCAGITGNAETNMTVVIDVEGAYTFKWYFANDSLAIIYPEKPEPVLTNGYYLVGKFDGIDAWDPVAENLFAVNPDNENEYQLSINLAVDDEVKVVYVENDAIVTWFPAEGDNYVIDDHHNGATTMYFRPDYQGGEGWFAGCIYVVPTSTVGFENTAADTKAVKVLKNGILVIEKNNKVYNVLGIEMK